MACLSKSLQMSRSAVGGGAWVALGHASRRSTRNSCPMALIYICISYICKAMKIVADETILRSLLDSWAGGLDWDQGNLGKLAKHKATPEDIDYLFIEPEAGAVLLGRIMPTGTGPWPEARYLTFGIDLSDKPRAVIWTTRSDKIRPISCRIMRRGERTLYESIK